MTVAGEHRIETGKAGPAAARTWLDRVDALVDWTRFDKYLRWLDPSPECRPAHPPLVLFKAMLVLHWYALIAIEFDTEMEDRRSFRRFVGLAGDQPPPGHAAVSGFRRLLLERDIAVEIFSELRDQLDRFDLSTLVPAFDAARGGTGPRIPCAIATDIRLFRPPDWVTLEQSFLNYWNGKHRGRKVPVSTDAALSDVPDCIAPHLVLVRCRPDDGGFRFERVGERVEAANQGAMVGSSLGEKARRNIQEYGHPGIQGELERLFRAAAAGSRPIGIATNLLNARGNRCRVWAMVAPVRAPPGGDQMLLGVALIDRLSPAAPGPFGDEAVGLAPAGGAGNLSALTADLQALGPPEWLALEQSFLDYWYRKRRDRPAPLMRDIELGEAPELDPHLALIRVLADGKFRYAHVGSKIEAANQGNLVGATIDQRAAENLMLRGHVGLQGELAAMFHHAVVEMRPVGAVTYFVNSAGSKCQIWGMSAPLIDDRGRVTMLIGVALIRPVAVN